MMNIGDVEKDVWFQTLVIKLQACLAAILKPLQPLFDMSVWIILLSQPLSLPLLPSLAPSVGMATMNSIIILDDDEDEVPSSSTSHTPPPRDPTNYTPQQSHTPPFPTNHTTKPTPDPPTSSNHKPDPSTTPSSSTNRSSSGLLVNKALFDEVRIFV